MSREQNISTVPDASGKLIDDEDKSLYESSRTDSGFISSGNLMLSGELRSEEIKTEEDEHDDVDRNLKEEEHMHLDSGVCLTESFSNLSLKGLNNLSCPQISVITPSEPSAPVDCRKQEEVSWITYYEQDEDGDTYLHAAIVQRLNKRIPLALIRAAPLPRLLDTPNDNAQTPLHLAIETGQAEIARWLVVAGARPSPRDIHGDSPLHIAARNGDIMGCRAILEAVKQEERDWLRLNYQQMYQPCKLDQWNYQGQTCVHVAAQNGHVAVLRHLVWYGADINAREGCMGYTALHYAVQRNDEALLRYLLTECKKLDVEAVTYGGRSALQLGFPVPITISEALRCRGVPSPFSSDDEYDSDSDIDGEATYENSSMLVPNLVNASA